MARDPDRRPTHPGEVLREDVLPALNLTQAQFAARLGVSRLTVSELLNEHRALSPEMAVRLERCLTEGDAEFWLSMQRAVDLWEARRELDDAKVALEFEFGGDLMSASDSVQQLTTQANGAANELLNRLRATSSSITAITGRTQASKGST